MKKFNNYQIYTFLKRFILVFIVLEICFSSNTKTANSQIYKAIEYAIAIDADTSDWQGILFETINKKTHLWVGQGMLVENWEGLNDLSFTWRAAWKSNKIYFLFVVTDNKISPFNRPNSWLNDCVEICIDPKLTRGMRKEIKNEKVILNGYETHFLPMLPPHAFMYDDHSPYFLEKPQDDDFKNLWNGEIAVNYTESGYILELGFSIPETSLQKGTVLGIEIAVCDDDGNSRKSLLTWTGIQNDYWVKMDKYGKLIFK